MPINAPAWLTTLLATCTALLAFAANSILCRLALGEETIDAAGFTLIRLASGALTLLAILHLNRRSVDAPAHRGSWASAVLLFTYAICFSLAYRSLETGTGALILFGSVQLTMLGTALWRGERFKPLEWLGIIAAIGGFVYMQLPAASPPPLSGFLLMALAGAAWGGYTLRGRGSATPLADTAHNFLRTLPLCLLLALVFIAQIELSGEGILLAVLSGALASGLGYSIWYRALPRLAPSTAAISQLLVPVIATAGGVIWVGEAVSLPLVIAAALILGGVALVLVARMRL